MTASPPAEEVPSEEPSAASDPAAKQAELDELKDLLASVIGFDYDLKGSEEEIQRFFALARGSDALAELLGELEAAVAASPEDLQARMDLADAYVAKLMTTAHGPEQGVIGAKAEGQWREVVARDPGHWAANFALGNNYSFYPDVMGKTPEAIAYLEAARSIQEKLDPTPEHVRTYLSLSRLYLREGRKAEARAVLEEGLRHHPGNAEILAELERLDRAG